MIDWNALAEKHKLGTTDVERTLTLVCRELAGLVPQELPMPGEPVPDIAVTWPGETRLFNPDGPRGSFKTPAPTASLKGEEAASG